MFSGTVVSSTSIREPSIRWRTLSRRSAYSSRENGSSVCSVTAKRDCPQRYAIIPLFRRRDGEAAMGTFRLYTGSDGEAHIESIDLARTPEWSKGLATTQIAFREDPVGRFLDWHPAPRRQFVIILSGQLEIGLGDGSKHIFGP